MLLLILLSTIRANDCICPIEDFVVSKGITLEKAKYYAFGAAAFVLFLIVTVITLAGCLCCTCSKLKRKKAKVGNLSNSIDDEKGYNKFLEYQRRYENGTSTASTMQAPDPSIVTYPSH